MNYGEIVKKLHEMAEQNLFGEGTWPADEKSSIEFWQFANEYLFEPIPDRPEFCRTTSLAEDYDVDAMISFIGADDPDFVLASFGWDDERCFSELEQKLEDESISQEHMAQLVKHYVRGAYFRFCARAGFKPFSRATPLPRPPGDLQSTAIAS